MSESNTPVYDTLFEITVNICERFPSLNPLVVRRMRAREVFRFLKRFLRYSKKEAKNRDAKGNRIIRRPAGDNWF